MNRVLKKLISGITTLSLCMTAISIPIAAADEPEATTAPVTTQEPEASAEPTEPEINRKLYLDFLGREKKPTDMSKLTSKDQNEEFWVGVGVDNISDLPLFTNGVYSLEVAIEYDTDFLVPYSSDKTWQEELEKGNLSDTWWNPSKYEITAVTDADTNAIKQRSGSLIDTGGTTKVCTVCITFKKDQTFENARFTDWSDDSKQYLVKLPFTLKRAPLESDLNQKPIVLDIVRGPEALNIGSGANGKTPYSEWEVSGINPAGAENMHTLFRTNDSLSLFGADGEITDIVPIKTKTGSETNDTRYTLFKDKLEQQGGFDPGVSTYYLTVANDVKKLKLEIASSGSPTVTANGATVISSEGNGVYTTDEFDLLALNRDVNNGGEADGFNNTVTVELGDSKYTIYIRQLLEPKIVLKPGNSPYGLIEAMSTKYLGTTNGWDDKRISDAKTDFINASSSAEANRFKRTAVNGIDDYYVPTNANTELIYYIGAWEDSVDSAKNMDRNIYSIFAYNGESFADTGFEAYDSMGDPVDSANITREITVKRMSDANISAMNTSNLTDLSITKTGVAGNYTFDDLRGRDENGRMIYICPGKYEMKYSFVDPVTGETVENARDDSTITDTEEKAAENLKRRYIVYVWTLGDANMSTAVDVGDRGTVNEILASVTTFDDMSSETEALYKFRIADANNSSAIDVGDRGTINEFLASMTKRPFYK